MVLLGRCIDEGAVTGVQVPLGHWKGQTSLPGTSAEIALPKAHQGQLKASQAA
jgi:hypothetical protein